MAFGSITLIPGVNTEKTPTALRAGFSVSSLIRFRDALVQKLGGWLMFTSYTVAGIPRDIHAWQDLNQVNRLAVGTTSQLVAVNPATNTAQNLTPQTFTSSFAPNVSTTSGMPTLTIVDPNATNVTINDSVLFNVPLSIGGLIFFGLYPITLILGANSYKITAATNATATNTNPTATNGTTAAGNNTLNFATTPTWLVAGMVIADLTTPAAIPASTTVVSTTVNTVVMSNNAVAPGVGSGDNIVFASVPVFTTALSSAIVTVTFINHGLAVGQSFAVQLPTTGNGITINGLYEALTIVDANNFTIAASTLATASGSFAMNGGQLNLTYYIALGPPTVGAGFGLGGFGVGGFGIGGVSSGILTGTPITATDWTLDNWGSILLACPRNGPIYFWDPAGGFANAQVISAGPAINLGIFVSTTTQILIAYGSTTLEPIGVVQQPLLVQWSDITNFLNWTVSSGTAAGSYIIPTGSTLIAGLATPNQNLLWTDLDLWAMNYIGPPFTFGFNKIGAGAGAVSAHSVQQLRGAVFWMSPTNFFAYTSSGPQVLPCPVWDAVFQNINTSFLRNVRAMPNTPFNEVGWLYPSAASVSGECDSYVKFNMTEEGSPWDYGPLQRSTWIDQTILGMPIGTTSTGVIYQHEVSPDAAGAPLVSSFTTGFFYLAEGEDFAFVDQVLPDFKWSTFPPGQQSAMIQITFNVVNYPGDTPIIYGPYSITQATEFISVRFRGRLMSVTVQSADLGSFWRIGSIKYRWSASGRR